MGYAVGAYLPTLLIFAGFSLFVSLSPAVLPIGNLSRQSPDLIVPVWLGAWKPNPEVAMQHANEPS